VQKEKFIFGADGCRPLQIGPRCKFHGKKIALLVSAVIGEIAAALLDGKTPPFDLSLFAPDRFRGPGGTERAKCCWGECMLHDPGRGWRSLE
jgi:hypothetical protein